LSELFKREDFKVEIINGKEIVMMAPASDNHNVVKNTIFGLFFICLKNSICTPYADGSKVVLEENGYVIPDVFILCDKSKRRKDGIHGFLDLIVEVLSPSTAEIDKGDKKDLYERAGVKEYWIVEADENRSIPRLHSPPAGQNCREGFLLR